MQKRVKLITICLVLVFALILGVQSYYFLTADFWPSKVQHPLKYRKEWQIDASFSDIEKAKSVLQQPFSYLDRGAQAFAFLSEDGRYVLKLFKFKHLRLNFLESALPHIGFLGTFKESKQRKREKKYDDLMLSYKRAYEHNRVFSGLLFCHLNPTEKLFEESICVYDKLGIKWEIPADSLAFVIQKRVKTTEKKLEELVKNGLEENLFSAVDSLLSLYMKEYEKGLVDRDHWVLKNTGFDGDEPLRIDVGNLFFESLISENYYRLVDISYVGWKLLETLRQKDQKIAAFTQKKIEEFIERTFSVSFSYDLYTPYQFWSLPQ